MKNLTRSQKTILDNLLPKLTKTVPHEELLRVSLLFREIKEIEKDEFLFDQFKTIINNQLFFHLKSRVEFYDLERFKNSYESLVKDYINDNIDADENDFIREYINSQNEVINGQYTHTIKLDGYKSLELMQFVPKDFFDEFIRSSKKKITFLEGKLNTQSTNRDQDNPHPNIFKNSNIFKKFIEYTSKHIIHYYKDYSYLKKRLEDEELMHRMKDNQFMHFLYTEMDLLSKKDYDDYTINKGGLESLKKSSSSNRENNFNNVFNNE